MGIDEKYWRRSRLERRHLAPDVVRRYWLSGPADAHFHREDGPAIELEDGSKEWFRNGRRHRDDGPAVERAGRDADRLWYVEDRLRGK